MFNKFNNLKIVQNLKSKISPKFRWLSYAGKSTLDKSTTDYLESITGIEDVEIFSDDKELETMVRAQLKEEFPNIENMKSYELLVDAVVHNMKKKQITETESSEIE